ncbi:hypothetical protein NK6_9127 [Bradyrhizobium diazoefficiens]|uniref:Uncharacterized protein n=1 Tax=Bradyrhizobium diazoefficiens TaxID=1355477 RepID=A0A0E4BX93_9BRAD|nr:hypothetical protein NK6_9127 [Bradyrhizobium diazoefficiens]
MIPNACAWGCFRKFQRAAPKCPLVGVKPARAKK